MLYSKLTTMVQPGDVAYLNKNKPPFKKNSQGRVTEVLGCGLIVLHITRDENCRDSNGIVFVFQKDLVKGTRCI